MVACGPLIERFLGQGGPDIDLVIFQVAAQRHGGERTVQQCPEDGEDFPTLAVGRLLFPERDRVWDIRFSELWLHLVEFERHFHVGNVAGLRGGKDRLAHFGDGPRQLIGIERAPWR